MNISMNGTGVQAIKILTDKAHLEFHAEELDKQRTGVHGKLSIVYNGITLAWSRQNIERQDDRTRLANKAHGHLSPAMQDLYTKNFIQHDLDLFCKDAWNVYVMEQMPGLVEGGAATPVEFLVNPFVIQGGGTILFAPPGRGKSWTGMVMAVCVDSGKDDIFKVKQAPTIYINLERSASSMIRRLGAVNRALILESGRPIYMLNARGKRLSDVVEALKRTIDEHNIQFGVLDSISRSGRGDLNANEVANNIIDVLNGMLDSWLGLAHTPRADESHVFGGVHFDAGADIVVQLRREQQENRLGLGLEITKSNDVGWRPMQVIDIEFDNETDLPWSIQKGRPDDFPELMVGRKLSATQEIEEVLLELGEATAEDVSDRTGKARNHTSEILSKSKRFVTTRMIGKKKYFAAVYQRAENYEN
jgi:hypothetical protein